MYNIKTRNWNGNRLVRLFLSLLPLQTDGERYWYASRSAVKAWSLWLVIMALRPLSGGWTYIVRPGAEVDGRYLSIY